MTCGRWNLGGMVAAAIGVATALAVATGADGTPAGSAADLVIRDVRVFDGERVLERATVVVRDGRIAEVMAGGNDEAAADAVTDDTEVIDGAGRTLLPGLIDAHTHSFAEAQLTAALAFGVTTVLDQFTRPEPAAAWKEQQEAGAATGRADLFTAGVLATAEGGHGTQYGYPVPTVDSPGEAEQWVTDRVAEGSDWIKLVIDDGSAYGLTFPTLDAPRVEALVAAAHRHGLKAVAHVARLEGARMAARAGADGLVHIWIDHTPDSALIERMSGMFVIPTLTVTESVTGHESVPGVIADPRIEGLLTPEAISNLERSFPGAEEAETPASFDSAMASVRALHAAGITLLAGTDAPNPGTTHGASLHHELELLVAAGLTPIEALRAATANPADAFGLANRGRIEPGLRADLLLVEGDPTRDITATRSIVAVWKAGHRFDRAGYGRRVAASRQAAERAAKAPGRGPGPISNFDDGTRAAAFGSWAETTDAIQGGTSVVTLEMVDAGDGQALRVTGETKAGVPYPWSGVMFFPGARPMSPVNLSGADSLAFRTRGDGGAYQVLLFHQEGGMIPLSVDFQAGEEWAEVVIPWSRFEGADGTGVMGIAFVAGSTPRGFEFLLDDVELR